MSEFDAFFKSAFSVDCVVFGFDESDLKVLLIKRAAAPYKEHWALPGDLVYPDENLDDSSARVLEELTGLENVYLEQVNTFGAVDRHPAGRVITIAYYSLIKTAAYNINASSFAEEVRWHSVADAREMNLAFDHNHILQACYTRLQRRVRIEPIGFELLPRKFTLTEMQALYEAILETQLDKRNFRKKILSMNLLVDLKETQAGVAHRPAKLYSFDEKKYLRLRKEGFYFEITSPKVLARAAR